MFGIVWQRQSLKCMVFGTKQKRCHTENEKVFDMQNKGAFNIKTIEVFLNALSIWQLGKLLYVMVRRLPKGS